VQLATHKWYTLRLFASEMEVRVQTRHRRGVERAADHRDRDEIVSGIEMVEDESEHIVGQVVRRHHAACKVADLM
jgi:hypothetical protein